MRNFVGVLMKFLAAKFGLTIIKMETLESLQREHRRLEPYLRWTLPSVPSELGYYVISNLGRSKSQIQQDLLVSFLIPENGQNRFFVEFGATDGISLSNTYLLEKDFGWKGILCEPAIIWQAPLKINRNCAIDFSCVHSQSGRQIGFSQTESPELSTISEFSFIDSHSKSRRNSIQYQVDTISLADLLKKHNAPKKIDYLSIDTEGSEFQILENFPFDSWEIAILSVEHNFTKNKEQIDKLLFEKGYRKILEDVSLFDGWYVNSLLAKRFTAG